MAEYVCEVVTEHELIGDVHHYVRRERVVRCRDCEFCEVVPSGSTCFCRKFYEKPDWGLPEHYAGSEPCEMAEVDFDGFCAWGQRRDDGD